jgi:hypothetical protein
MDHAQWAQEEFGAAALGDGRRTARLVKMVSAVLEHPNGTVLKSIAGSAEREGAYRFLENPRIVADAIEDARATACIRRIEAEPDEVIVALDQTSFKLPDHTGERDFGSVGSRSMGARGVQVLTALALDAQGAPLGVLSQVYWARSELPGPPRLRPNKKQRDRRPPEEKESKYWAQSLDRVCKLLKDSQSDAVPWLQCDRGADIWSAFMIAVQAEVRITVRVYADRQIVLDDGSHGRLQPWIDALPTMGSYEVEVPATEKRSARTATLSVHYGRATVLLGPKVSDRDEVPLYFVHVHEEQPPDGEAPLCWKLATTFPVRSLRDALRVVDNYKLRWRIEELHHTIKSGACNLEMSQLESFDAFRRWAIIHTSVAARVERLKHLSRTEPDAPASVEFTRDEIDTAIVLRHAYTIKNKPPYKPGDTPTLGEITLWIADLGGYMGPRRHPKPGSVPLGRGLERLEIYVQALKIAGEILKLRSD